MRRKLIKVSLKKQRLTLLEDDKAICDYPVSTAKNGAGQLSGSECTPTGRHQIRAKIGDGMAEGAVFVGRRPTGEIYNKKLDSDFPGRDWILSRILWLSGLEPGFNRSGKVDTFRRYIYLHGSPDHCVTGAPDSHGCIRMKNGDIIDLFDRIDVGVEVIIEPETS